MRENKGIEGVTADAAALAPSGSSRSASRAEPPAANAGHTPGPWRVRENSRHSPEECDLSICGDIWVLADINGPQYAHQEANARLIAAAPELLEEAQQALDLISGLQGSFDDGSAEGALYERVLADRVMKLRAAIAKATGAA